MSLDTQTVFLWRFAPTNHPVELLPQLLTCRRNVPIPAYQFAACVKAAQISVARPVAKPTSHLHQRVVHL